jgi:hypothetical protein
MEGRESDPNNRLMRPRPIIQQKRQVRFPFCAGFLHSFTLKFRSNQQEVQTLTDQMSYVYDVS